MSPRFLGWTSNASEGHSLRERAQEDICVRKWLNFKELELEEIVKIKGGLSIAMGSKEIPSQKFDCFIIFSI